MPAGVAPMSEIDRLRERVHNLKDGHADECALMECFKGHESMKEPGDQR